MNTKNVKSFIKETVARLTGDTDEAIAQRNFRLASAAVRGQLSKLDGKQVKAEVALERAEEKFLSAIYPTTEITDDSAYIRNIAARQEDVDSAQESLDYVKASIKFFKGISDRINAED